GPDVVVLIDAHGMRFRPGVEALADFAQESPVGTELEELRGGGSVCRAVGAVGSREHEDVPLGIDGYAGHFAEIHSRRKLEKIGHGIKGKLGHILLCKKWG